MKTIQPLIIAHRGNSSAAPENTVSAVKSAWKAGADAVEIDVQGSKDNKIMVIHDENTLRTTGKNFIIQEESFRKLRKLDAGSYRQPKFPEEKIPFLSEILENLPPGKQLYIEWKDIPAKIPVLAEIIRLYSNIADIRVIALNPGALTYIRHFFPSLKVFWVIGEVPGCVLHQERVLKHMLRLCRRYRFTGADLYYKLLSPAVIALFHGHNQQVLTWTVNCPEKARQYASWGIDGITTDCPKTIRDSLL